VTEVEKVPEPEEEDPAPPTTVEEKLEFLANHMVMLIGALEHLNSRIVDIEEFLVGPEEEELPAAVPQADGN